MRAGFAKCDITAWEPEMAMCGWGRTDGNRIRGVAEPLHARAMVVESEGGRFAYVVADLLFVSLAVRQAVLARLAAERPDLGLDESRVVLTATHTHSGPSGFSHYFWLNMATPGFSPLVFEAVASGVFDAIVAAAAAAEPARLRLVAGEIGRGEGIAFNRSWFAYSRNRDVAPVPYERREDATDPAMTCLVALDAEERPFGALVWYPLHGTCVHSDNELLHPDHKGLAARALDEALTAPGRSFCSLFAQEAAGDVTPNFRFDAHRGFVVGRFDDDLQSAEHVAGVEARVARAIVERAGVAGVEVSGPLWARTERVDFAVAPADARFSQDGRDHHTSPARLGVSMAQGTVEGPGPLLPFHRTVRRATRVAALSDAGRGLVPVVGRRRHDPKITMLELGAGGANRFLGVVRLERLGLVAKRDVIFGYVHAAVSSGAAGRKAWIAQVIPLQLVRLGPLVLATAPFEITTVAGRRLRRVILEALAPVGVTTVVVNAYANGYCGYLTTYEEYQCQHYEAGYTVFGPWTEAAVRTAFAGIASAMARGERGDAGPDLDRFEAHELAGRHFSAAVAWRA